MLVDRSVSVTSAPPITAPVVSVIRPVTLEAPVAPCPKSRADDIRRQKTHSSQSDSFLIMSLSPLTILQISQLTDLGYCTPICEGMSMILIMIFSSLATTSELAGGCPFSGSRYNFQDNGIQVFVDRSEEHTSELQSLRHLVCRLLL